MADTGIRQRLAAILAADVAGYSRLMAADERATVTALDSARAVFRTQIESNQGRVIDMAGDSVLAVFETATGAVSAALAVQQELDALGNSVPQDRRMRFRVGVHMGDVIEKTDGTVYGDGVNIAARLEGLAQPGGITVSESIRTAVKGKVNTVFEDQGEQTVKNVSEPVRTYRVKREGAGVSQPSPAAGEIDLSLPDKPSIAILPFANMSGDPEQEYFTDGITEDIITELSRFHSLFVIARKREWRRSESQV
ncbi:MAG: adenylate/guanylate cyclase domain-containing protein [Betaproteobacteria bacterium]|nr:adenylate/guanylate cyclase domain-containing protein [Betaproteobacteria bacterium]